MPDHAKEYSFNVIEFTIRANESCFEEFECGGEKVLTGLRDSCHSQAIRESMPSKFSSYQGVF